MLWSMSAAMLGGWVKRSKTIEPSGRSARGLSEGLACQGRFKICDFCGRDPPRKRVLRPLPLFSTVADARLFPYFNLYMDKRNSALSLGDGLIKKPSLK